MNGYAERYSKLQSDARRVNHEVRIVVIPGSPLVNGQQLTLAPFNVEWHDLDAAIDDVAEYLRSDEARSRGQLYMDRSEKRRRYESLVAQMLDARRDLEAANALIETDVDDKVFGASLPLEA